MPVMMASKGKAFLREMTMELGFLLMALGAVLMFFSSLSLFFYVQSPRELADIVNPLRDTHWDMWGFFFGMLMVLIGALVFGDKLLKLMEFKRLLNSPSRATIIKKRDRLEYLAWKLTKRQEDELEAKLDELKIRD